MSSLEAKLLSRLTDPAAIGRVWEMGLTKEVFEEIHHQLIYDFIIEYWLSSEMLSAPTALVIETEGARHRVRFELDTDVEEEAWWLAEQLIKRSAANAVQEVVRHVVRICREDPIEAVRFMHAASSDALGLVPAKGFDDEFLYGDQLDELPSAEPLIDGVLMRHAYSVLRGRDHSFKSFIALDWSLCLATGLSWQGRRVQQVKVLYVIGEGAWGIAPRKRAWEIARKVCVDPQWFVVRKSAVNLYKSGPAFDHLLARIRREGYGLVVFDTLRWMSSGADANGSDMALVVDNLDRVKRATADGSVQLVAHTDKTDKDTRGFSGIEDDADIVWATSREPDAREVSLVCKKMKDGPSGHRLDLRVRTAGESLVVVADRSCLGTWPSTELRSV